MQTLKNTVLLAEAARRQRAHSRHARAGASADIRGPVHLVTIDISP